MAKIVRTLMFLTALMSVSFYDLSAQVRVVCSVPDLADIVAQIGGDEVSVESFARPGDNPHFISARPSFIRKLASADVFVVSGMDLEVGWAPALLRSARNRKVQPNQPGYIDCSAAITPLEVPGKDLDRSFGDVHPHGNPHYLLSPLCALQVIYYLGDRLAVAVPEKADHFRNGAEKAAQLLASNLYGEELVRMHSVKQLIEWHLVSTLDQQVENLGGWLAAMAPLQGTQWIDDHSQWPYLAACYQIKIIAHLEPKAGVPPSSSHIKSLVDLARGTAVKGVIMAPWFDPRHAQTLARAASLPMYSLAHQSGALQGTAGFGNIFAQHVSALTAAIK